MTYSSKKVVAIITTLLAGYIFIFLAAEVNELFKVFAIITVLLGSIYLYILRRNHKASLKKEETNDNTH